MTRTLFVLILIAAASHAASAQVANPTAPAATAASFGLGFDHGGIVEVGYRQPVRRLDDAAAHVRLQVPSVPGLGEGGLELGLTTGRVGAYGWGVTTTLSTTLRWVDGELLDLAQGGFAVRGAAGYFRPSWLATVELTWDHALLTYVQPTARYRRLVYADAEGGLHGSGGGTLRGGLAAGVAATRRIEVTVRAGYLVTEALNAAPGLPFYAVLGGAVAF